MEETITPQEAKPDYTAIFRKVVVAVLLVIILAVAAYFRFTGVNWDDNAHLHPDERFLTMVTTAIQPDDANYFNTAESTLNPHNRGFGFYVYGTLPIILVRYIGEALGQTGYDEITLLGRQISAIVDLLTILVLFWIGTRIYNARVGLLAALFSGLAVTQIQQSHYYTVDNFATFFMTLAAAFAVEIMLDERPFGIEASQDENRYIRLAEDARKAISQPIFIFSLLFGLALGMAMASKINAAPLAILLPAALAIHFFRVGTGFDQTRREEYMVSLVSLVVVGAFFTVLAFRIFQPYAFNGPGFFGVLPNDQWVQNMQEQRLQAGGDVDFPPALQWARRSVTFSGYNLFVWGLGLPLGLLSIAGFLFMGWRILKGEWRTHILLWGWTAIYFTWQSIQWNPTMRYQLPIYPLLALMAGWLILNVPGSPRPALQKLIKFATLTVALLVTLATATWAYAFTRIYNVPHTRVEATRWIYQNLPGPVNLFITQADGSVYHQPIAIIPGYTIQPSVPLDAALRIFRDGSLESLTFGKVIDTQPGGAQTIYVSIFDNPGYSGESLLARGSVEADFLTASGPFTVRLDNAIPVIKDQTLYFRIESTGAVNLLGTAPINESSWDDGLPLRIDGYDGYGGLYQGGLNLELYWDDNIDKVTRFQTNLDNGDYIFISSNRQWATTTRVPERYPLTTAYYRALLGCPEDQDIIWCYNVARPGMFNGQLGYELVQVFESYPNIQLGDFHWEANTQFAEEAFSVYDHPKVLIFQKTEQYDPEKVRAVLESVDLSRVIRVTPRKAASLFTGDLMLPDATWQAQQEAGTWSELFSYENLQNKYPVVGLLLWYLAITVLGWLAYPLLRLFLPGLPDKGYPLARLAGLLLLAYISWAVGSLGGTYSRLTIALAYGLIGISGLAVGWWKRKEIKGELATRMKYFGLVEAVFLVIFLIDLVIRIGNPDLWHPSKGGERPMDFSYFNAILKSETFPPYDPWFAGGYINYYYWGFVLVGTPVKLLGIVPSIAYNFILPTLFAMLALAGFSVAWNLLARPAEEGPSDLPIWGGLAASLGLVLVGNLGTIRMIFHGLQKMAVGQEAFANPDAWFFERLAWAGQGALRLLIGENLPFGWGDWYWLPSRVIPAPGEVEPITEFPLFTFLYSDLHAHMISLPLTALAVAWAVSTLFARRLQIWEWLLSLAFGGLVIGALRPVNTWDFPTYLILGMVVAGYAIFRYAEVGAADRFGLPHLLQRAGLALAGMAALAGFALLFYEPYVRWYGLGYSSIAQWTGTKTPFASYVTHWGLFLFIIVTWMVWEAIDWMAKTPLSSVSKLRPYTAFLQLAGLLAIVVWAVLQFFFSVQVAWLVLPLALLALVLILRPGQPDAKRLALFMVGTGLLLTLVVEVIVLVGDIGRMNTVFKFYLQVWVMFAIVAAAAFAWLLDAMPSFTPGWRNFYSSVTTVLIGCALLFTFTASMAKIRDRITPEAPIGLDSLSYMEYTRHWDGGDLDLVEDFRAIRWMQENIPGTSVIVEAHTPEYRWGSRYTIYTGLPGVVGWNWHQRQQRAVLPDTIVFERVNEINDFYATTDVTAARAFLEKYNVRYIVVGQLEMNYYPGDGLLKFPAQEGRLWEQVYQDGRTTIYQVLP